MALQSVKFTLNGQTYDLTLDGATGQYKATITAPAESSWGAAEDHKYHGTVEAKDLAGNTAQATVTQFPGLGLRVLEKTKPTISVTYPTNGAYIPSSQPTITWTVLDDGSGIDPDTIQIQVDSGAATSEGIQTEATEGGYTCSYTPATALGDGPHTFRFTVSDHDGNAADAATVAVTVDTVPPTLNVTAPAEGLVTNQGALTVQGITNDEASSPVTVKVQVGSGEPVAATVDGEGNFQAQVTLSEGANAITVTATDAAGKSTTVTRNVTVDTVPPAITAVTLAPQPGGRRPDLRDHRDGERLMVARLWGTCQGQDVLFSPTEDGRWTCWVPASPTGAYSLQLWAEDLAGNVGYLATIRLAFDPAGLCCRVEILAIGSLCDYDTLARMLGADPLAAVAGADPVCAAPAADPLRAKITGFARCCG